MNRVRFVPFLSPRVYYILPLLLVLAAGGDMPAAAVSELGLTVEPTMTKGAADAPVTIIEFSDYQ